MWTQRDEVWEVKMKKAGVIVTLVVLMATSFAVLTVLPANVKAATLYVGGAGPGNYTTIQGAIDAASPGDTVYVYNGTYYEAISISKTLSLIGESSNTTIIDGGGSGYLVRILTDWVNFTGFTVRNAETGIRLNSVRFSHLHDNIVVKCREGIVLGRSDRNTISRNTVSEAVSFGIAGIGLYSSDHNTIANNTIHSNGYAGILVDFSNGNVVADNDIQGNSEGIILQAQSQGNLITNNFVSSNTDMGIGVGGYEYWDAAYLNGIIGNTVSSNYYGITFALSRYNVVYHNNLIGNTVQASDSEDTIWDDGHPSGGNYWSDYAGVDEKSGPSQNQSGSDGIGDTPYVIDANSTDRYPLMYPWNAKGPRPPAFLDATLSGKNSQNTTITWSLSPDDGGGSNSVTGYEVYRSVTFDPEGRGYQLVVRLPKGTDIFIDSLVGEGNPESYFYRVCAADWYDNVACSWNQAGKFTRPLSKGPNFISVPLIQSNESIGKVLQTVEYDKAWFYDSFSQEWKWYMTSKGYRRGLWDVNHTMGLWVNVTDDSNLTVAGIVPAQTTIHLYGGWNLVGFPSFSTTYMVADLKAETGATRVEGYDPSPPNFLRVLGDAEVLQVGYGYWVRVEAGTVWTITIE